MWKIPYQLLLKFRSGDSVCLATLASIGTNPAVVDSATYIPKCSPTVGLKYMYAVQKLILIGISNSPD